MNIKLFVFVVFVTLGIMPLAQAAPPLTEPVETTVTNVVDTTVANVVEWRVVGVSIYEDDGSFEFGTLLGVAAMNKVCRVDFGDSAKAATIQEALQADLNHVAAWVVPGNTPMVVEPFPQGLAAYDSATGVLTGSGNVDSPADTIEYAYCIRFATNNAKFVAPSIAQTGQVVYSSCNVVMPVACSKPVVLNAGN